MSRQAGVVRHYWDACLFLDRLNKTPGRIDVLDALWDEAVAKEAKVIAVTSVLTIAEVAFVAIEKKLRTLDPAALKKIDGFWDPPMEMIELYDGIAYEARDLMREAVASGQSLKAHDAIHLATAKRRGVTKFWTYDSKLHAFTGRYGFPIIEPISGTLPFVAATP